MGFISVCLMSLGGHCMSNHVVIEPDRQCLLCHGWPEQDPVPLDSGRFAVMCSGCRGWFPKFGAETRQGAVTAWHRLMHPQYLHKARVEGSSYGCVLISKPLPR